MCAEASLGVCEVECVAESSLGVCEVECVAESSLGVCEVECVVCSRRFRRESDRRRHKCIEERQKPISEQRGAA